MAYREGDLMFMDNFLDNPNKGCRTWPYAAWSTSIEDVMFGRMLHNTFKDSVPEQPQKRVSLYHKCYENDLVVRDNFLDSLNRGRLIWPYAT